MRLLAPAHLVARIGIRRVSGRIVIPRDAAQHRSLGHQLGLFEHVDVLPFELVPRHVEQHLALPVGIHRLEPERLSAQVHVRQKRINQRVLIEAMVSLRREIGVAGRDLQVHVDGRDGRHLLADRLGIGEDQADLAAVGLSACRAGVMHLEHQLRPGRNQLGGSLGQNPRRHPRRIGRQEVDVVPRLAVPGGGTTKTTR